MSQDLYPYYERELVAIRQLAQEVEVTHSAMSQTVTAMRAEGLVETAPGEDARTRTVALTEQGRALVPFLDDEWRATERAAWIAASAAAESPARVSINRDTVGSEAIGPNTSGCARSCPMSARQSPPIASEMARSSRILPGSWWAKGCS